MTSWPALGDELRRKSGRNVELAREPEPPVVGQFAVGRASSMPPRALLDINGSIRDALSERRAARGGTTERAIRPDDLFGRRR